MYRIIQLFFFLTCSLVSYAQDFIAVDDVNLVKDKIRLVSESANSLSSDFVQEKHISFLEEVVSTKGIFKFEKEDKIRWEYIEPYSYIVVLKDGKLLIDDEGKKNKLDIGQNIMFKKISKMISKSMSGDVLEEQKEFTPVLEKNDEFYKVTLTPQQKRLQNYLEIIEVYFDKKSCLVNSVVLREGEEDFTRINFINMKLNGEVTEADFILNK